MARYRVRYHSTLETTKRPRSQSTILMNFLTLEFDFQGKVHLKMKMTPLVKFPYYEKARSKT